MAKIIALIGFLIIKLGVQCYMDDFISVNLSNYKLLTEDKPIWETPNKVSIPTFLEELEFECNSTFPTTWVLSINPLEDPELKDVPKIFKSRSREGPKGHFTFSSKILMKFKDPRGIQLFTCQNARDTDAAFRSVAIETKISSPDRLTTKFIADKVLKTTQKIYGESQDCGLVLEVDFLKRSFSCQRNGIRDLVPRLVLCRNPDECSTIANTEQSSCDKSVKLNCAHKDCRQFQPKKEPGVIVCGDGINSVAVRYAVLDPQGANSTILVKYDKSSSPSDFIHLPETKYIVYDKQEVNFICKASKYVYSRGFHWVLSSSSGVSHVVDEGNQVLKVLHGTYIINKTIRFDIALYGNVTKLSCLGPIWNSRESARAEAQIYLRVPVKPMIQESNRTINQLSGNFTVDCTYKADPQPRVTWFLWQRIISEDEEFFRLTHFNNRSSHFTVMKIENLAQQNRRLLRITCRVENFLGIEERLFILSSSEPETSNKLLIIIVICLLVFIVVLVTVGWFYLKWVRSKNLEYVKKEIQLFLEGNLAQENDPNNVSSVALRKPYDIEFEIALANMEIDRKNPLGSGAYGLVLRGVVFGQRTCFERTEVAIKTLKSNAEPACFKALLTELKVILYVGKHENIVNLIACCTEKIYEMELYIILELCHNGELQNYLKTHRDGFIVDTAIIGNSNSFSINNLLSFSYQIANGMWFLASKNVIHGDISTRNVLLNDNLICKICDFGLSRQLYEYSQYVKKQQQPLPWRWLSIESLRDMQFSTESDVWSYGVTLWEIFSLGQVPYPGQNWTNEFLQSLIEGLRLKKPVQCPTEIYLTMLSCWKERPQERPTFKELKIVFQKYI